MADITEYSTQSSTSSHGATYAQLQFAAKQKCFVTRHLKDSKFLRARIVKSSSEKKKNTETKAKWARTEQREVERAGGPTDLSKGHN